MFCSQNHKRKYNARDFDKSKASNLLKMLKGEHPTKKWQNCGTEVLCVMLIYDGAELARVVDKVLGIQLQLVYWLLVFTTTMYVSVIRYNLHLSA